MKGLVLDAKWDPRPDYAVTEWEKQTGKAITGSSVWRYPQLEVREKPMPQITKPGQALLEVQACGVCGSDIHFYERDKEGYMYYPGLTKFPVTTGHEFSAKVIEVSKDVDYLKPGTPVTVEEMQWCGYCTPCRNGFPNHCENLEEIGFTVDGAFQQYLVVDAKTCWPVDSILERYGEKLGYDVAAMSEPSCVAYNTIFSGRAGSSRARTSASSARGRSVWRASRSPTWPAQPRSWSSRFHRSAASWRSSSARMRRMIRARSRSARC